jgi:beta-hydroxylase
MSLRKEPFLISFSSFIESLDNYPELTNIQRHWKTIRDEAIVSRRFSIPILDGRSANGLWKVLPLKTEPEDQIVISDELCLKNRKVAPRTVELLESIHSVQAYSFSFLSSGGRIKPHRHQNPFVTASLCLQSGENSYMFVDGEQRNFQDGEFLVFDYRRLHEVANEGSSERISLLILLELRS